MLVMHDEYEFDFVRDCRAVMNTVLHIDENGSASHELCFVGEASSSLGLDGRSSDWQRRSIFDCNFFDGASGRDAKSDWIRRFRLAQLMLFCLRV